MSAKVEPLLTISDLDALPNDGNRYELFDGEIIVSCAPGLPHQRILTNIIFLFSTHLARHNIGEVIATPGVIFDDFNGVIPDVIYISHERAREVATGDRLTGAPELMIEIVSPGKENSRRDRLLKRRSYGRHGVEEYWIIDPEKRTVEIYRRDGRTLRLVATLADDEEVTPPLLPGFRCRARQVFGA
ncbi:MAG: Uma2 family endonuclease [Pyrinomonadaceae bacterium]